jgi:3-hydroxyisobutyrate dehydrogenase
MGVALMSKIGFIGLGTMGMPMAQNLLRKGFELIVHNRTRNKADDLAPLGAVVADTAADVAREADVVITMLGDDASIEAMYYGQRGVFEGLRPGATVMDCSTVSPELSKRIAADMQARGGAFLDAPVTGSKPAAESGTLVFMVGGQAEAIERVRDVLMAMGRDIVHMGPSGAGSQTKLAHNTMVGIHAAALAEGLAMAVRAGIAPAQFLSVVQSGGAASKQVELKRDKLLTRDYSNQFSLKFMLKDLRLASAMTDAMQMPSPMLAEAKALFQMGESQGLGEMDLCSIIQLYEQWTDTRIEG